MAERNSVLKLLKMESCQKSLVLVGKGHDLARFCLAYSFTSDDCTSIICHCFVICCILN